ncbi:MAG TPA: hypothetical protein VN847_12295 [Streptosporangiaceae bacterium]|nr:hypothetical protein [Streptosporangiaceae bacterium]
MPATLQEILLTPDTKPAVVADCRALVDQQVKDKSGISATALKLGYKTVTSFAPGYLNDTIDSMLPEFIAQLEPFWADFTASGSAQFGDYLSKRGPEVAEALLTVTDNMAGRSERPTIVKAYKAVRGGAAKHIEAALPAVGDLVQKYAG